MNGLDGRREKLTDGFGAAADGFEIEFDFTLSALVAVFELLFDTVDFLGAFLLGGVGDGLDTIHGAVKGLEQFRQIAGAIGIAGQERRPEMLEEFGGGSVREGDAVEE